MLRSSLPKTSTTEPVTQSRDFALHTTRYTAGDIYHNLRRARYADYQMPIAVLLGSILGSGFRRGNLESGGSY